MEKNKYILYGIIALFGIIFFVLAMVYLTDESKESRLCKELYEQPPTKVKDYDTNPMTGEKAQSGFTWCCYKENKTSSFCLLQQYKYFAESEIVNLSANKPEGAYFKNDVLTEYTPK